MSGTVLVKGKRDERLTEEFNKLLEECVALPKKSLYEKPVWLVGYEKRAALILDASKFYREIEGLEIRFEAKTRLAMQLSLDNNSLPFNLFRAEGKYGKPARVSMSDMQMARDTTGVRRVEDPVKYVDSVVSCMVKSGSLNKKKEKEVADIAREILAKCEESKSPLRSNPIVLSVAAAYHASCKAGERVGARDFSEVMRVSQMWIYEVDEKLEKIVGPRKPASSHVVRYGVV